MFPLSLPTVSLPAFATMSYPWAPPQPPCDPLRPAGFSLSPHSAPGRRVVFPKCKSEHASQPAPRFLGSPFSQEKIQTPEQSPRRQRALPLSPHPFMLALGLTGPGHSQGVRHGPWWVHWAVSGSPGTC